MLRSLNTSSGGRRILGTPYVGLLSEQIAEETATGTDGPGLLYNEAVAPENAGKRLRLRVEPWPAAGTLTVAENGAYEWSGLPDGSHTLTYGVYVDGVHQGDATLSVTVGAASANAPGAALSAMASISGGAATGGEAANAPGAELSATASLVAGAATGGGGALTLSPADIAAIAAAVVAALGATTIPVDVRKVNAIALTGTGAPGDPMRPA